MTSGVPRRRTQALARRRAARKRSKHAGQMIFGGESRAGVVRSWAASSGPRNLSEKIAGLSFRLVRACGRVTAAVQKCYFSRGGSARGRKVERERRVRLKG